MNNHLNGTGGTDVETGEHEQPRIVEEREVTGPDGVREIEATDDRGRRWYELRPQPRGRADVMGFNRTWWLTFTVVLLVIAFFPW